MYLIRVCYIKLLLTRLLSDWAALGPRAFIAPPLEPLIYSFDVILEEKKGCRRCLTADGAQTDAGGELPPVQSKHGDPSALWNVGY